MSRAIQEPPRVAIIGAGTIGVGWAVVFAQAGHSVSLHDVDPERLTAARRELADRLTKLASFDLIEETPATIGSRIEASTNLGRTVEGAGYVQECVPEALALKRDVFRSLDAAADPQAILASSTSAIRMSEIASDLPGRKRCLVVHPGNPPYLLRVAEIVPAWFTSNETVAGCRRLLSSAGMRPILVRKEVEGFIFNRLQGAVLREAYCLVRDGVASVDDIDCIMREGLGLRWSIIGPFETADLNVHGGITEHAKRMAAAYARMGTERGQHDPWTEELVAEVAAMRRAALPLEKWAERVAWRDRMLMAVMQAKSRATFPEEADAPRTTGNVDVG